MSTYNLYVDITYYNTLNFNNMSYKLLYTVYNKPIRHKYYTVRYESTCLDFGLPKLN